MHSLGKQSTHFSAPQVVPRAQSSAAATPPSAPRCNVPLAQRLAQRPPTLSVSPVPYAPPSAASAAHTSSLDQGVQQRVGSPPQLVCLSLVIKGGKKICIFLLPPAKDRLPWRGKQGGEAVGVGVPRATGIPSPTSASLVGV